VAGEQEVAEQETAEKSGRAGQEDVRPMLAGGAARKPVLHARGRGSGARCFTGIEPYRSLIMVATWRRPSRQGRR